MDINRAGKQQQAYWRNQEYWRVRWEAEQPSTDAEKAYGQYLRTVERLQGHAAGWLAGVAWARRNMKNSVTPRFRHRGKHATKKVT
jgi:hypothetical protein